MSSDRFLNDPDLLMMVEKLTADRIETLFADPLLSKIYADFGGSVFHRSSVFHGLAKFLQDQQVSGESCIEIGSWNGITAAILSRHFKSVVSIDIVDNPVKYEISKRYGLNIKFIHASQEQKHASLSGRRFNFAYLDGDHARDTRTDFDLVRRLGCKRVLMHEHWPLQPPVVELVKSLPGKTVFGGTCFALWTA